MQFSVALAAPERAKFNCAEFTRTPASVKKIGISGIPTSSAMLGKLAAPDTKVWV
jgi:hypothetical protein